jgi:ADP-ribosylglycohydrolase
MVGLMGTHLFLPSLASRLSRAGRIAHAHHKTTSGALALPWAARRVARSHDLEAVNRTRTALPRCSCQPPRRVWE